MQDIEDSARTTPRRVVWSVTPDQSHSAYVKDVVSGLRTAGWTVDSLSLQDVASTQEQIIHIQWPEHVSRGPNPAKTAAKHARALMLLAAFRARKHRIIVTAHNIAPHGDSDPFDVWFREQILKMAETMIVLIPGHENQLRKLGQIHRDLQVVHIDHPIASSEAGPGSDASRDGLLILGLIHPYHRILEFVDALISLGSTRPVDIVGDIGDNALVEQLEQRSATHDWLTISAGYVPNERLEPILDRTAAVVSLQKVPFNSGGPYFAFDRRLPVLLTEGSQAKYLKEAIGDEWVFEVPTNERLLDLESLKTWIDSPRATPHLDDFVTDAIAKKHADVYELTLTGE